MTNISLEKNDYHQNVFPWNLWHVICIHISLYFLQLGETALVK